MLDTVLFAAFPYVAVVLAVVGGIVRYYGDRFSFSSHSSQFLENRVLFWGSVSWHYGIIVVLLAHIGALAFSGTWGDVVANPTRLYTLEVIGIALGLAALIGLTALSLRRVLNARATVVTAKSDWVLLAVLLAQVFLGMWVALGYRWWSDWYVHTAAPWMHSLFKLQPDVTTVTVLPWVVKAHMLGGFVLLAMFPFTRLVHIVTYPLSYLWRPYQVVVWNRRSAR